MPDKFVAIFKLLFSSIALMLLASPVLAASDGGDVKDPVPVIMHHIMDSNEFHVVTINGHHISVPLPVIVLNTGTKSLDMFMSSKVAHGHEYKGYKRCRAG